MTKYRIIKRTNGFGTKFVVQYFCKGHDGFAGLVSASPRGFQDERIGGYDTYEDAYQRIKQLQFMAQPPVEIVLSEHLI